MLREICKSKIHRATVTKAELYYEGSISIDKKLMKEAGLIPYEKVHVLNLNNGSRIETYVIESAEDSGEICLNGPAAKHGSIGDEVVIISYGFYDEKELKTFYPEIVYVDKKNRIIKKVK